MYCYFSGYTFYLGKNLKSKTKLGFTTPCFRHLLLFIENSYERILPVSCMSERDCPKSFLPVFNRSALCEQIRCSLSNTAPANCWSSFDMSCICSESSVEMFNSSILSFISTTIENHLLSPRARVSLSWNVRLRT